MTAPADQPEALSDEKPPISKRISIERYDDVLRRLQRWNHYMKTVHGETICFDAGDVIGGLGFDLVDANATIAALKAQRDEWENRHTHVHIGFTQQVARAEKAEERVSVLVEALTRISNQMLISELRENDYEVGDAMQGYDNIIVFARKALASIPTAAAAQGEKVIDGHD